MNIIVILVYNPFFFFADKNQLKSVFSRVYGLSLSGNKFIIGGFQVQIWNYGKIELIYLAPFLMHFQ
jgi:hypothetical protein